ncbi:hypothetical protein FJZ33_04665 [Candidatus Poribacteria bacterium]|nr:hypothetical protein [Candidatus Poribacteria bacterium]
MAYAYTPGLKVSPGISLRKTRRLPLPGQILVKPGQKVNAETIVARTELPGHISSVNVAGILSIQPEEVNHYMLKTIGQQVKKDEVIASTNGLFGLFKSQCRAPVDGFIESISSITGQVMIREPQIPVEINAYIDGQVVEILQNEGVVIQTYGSFIQGIFGVGGETIGPLAMACQDPEDVLTSDKLTDRMKGNIIVGGSQILADSVKRAISLGVKGIVAGGIDDDDLRNLLGYELGVAITGSENIGITIIVTEGFGKINMAAKTFSLLKSCEGKKASINGATQIRAGVIRPEVVIPYQEVSESLVSDEEEQGQLVVGAEVRIIREPHFGELAEVLELPSELQKLETEAQVRVLKVKTNKNGEIFVLPRANVEIAS